MGAYRRQLDAARKDVRSKMCDRRWKFVDYLLDPRPVAEKGTQTDFARTLGIDPHELSRWKREPAFVAAWDMRALELGINPSRVRDVIDALFQAATDGDARDRTTAAKLYLEAAGVLEKAKPGRPARPQKAPDEMSDAELAAALAEEERGLRLIDGEKEK